MSRYVLAIAAMLLPVPALAQSAPAASTQPDSQAVAAPQQAAPQKRGFSIARAGAPAPVAKAAPAANRPHMAAPEAAMPEAKAGKMKRHMHRHHHRHTHHHG